MDILREKPSIGFIGLGIMGASMASHICKAGFKLHIYSRTRNQKSQDLIEQGAIWENTIADLAKKSQIIISIVGFPQDVEEIYCGSSGILENSSKGTIAIDMTTSDPILAKKLYDLGKDRDIFILDAPVSGGDSGAKKASLSIMAGGDKDIFETVLPLLEIMGTNIILHGGAGSGQHAKMANQIAIAAGMLSVCEALAYSEKSGLDLEKVLASISKGAAGSWSLTNLGPRIINKDHEPGFFIKHFIKDMKIALNSAKNLGLDTPGLSLALDLYTQLAERGLEEKGTQALFTNYF